MKGNNTFEPRRLKMMGNRNVIFSVTALLLFMLIGCSGGTSPVSPGVSGPELTANAVEESGQRHLWGVWDVTIDASTGMSQVIPLRGASFTANVNNILEGSPGNLMILDMEVGDFFTEGRLDCTISLRHPLPGLDMYHGFDVWGVFMHNGSASLGYDGLAYGDEENDAVLLNADGYTRWFNYTEFNGGTVPLLEFTPGALSDLPDPDAQLCPYKVFANGLSVHDDYYQWIVNEQNVENRGIYIAGTVNARRYELKFPMVGGEPEVSFQYAVVATWETGDPSLTGAPAVYDPYDFPSSANCEEAFFIHPDTTQSSLYYVDPATSGGSFKAGIEVFDWQGGSVGQLGVPYEVESITIEGDFIPGGSHQWMQAELELMAIPATVNSSVFQVEIIDCVPVAPDVADYWVIVEAAGVNGASYDQGFPTEYPQGARRAAYLPDIVLVGSESPEVPVTYNLVLDIERDSNDMITGIILDWDDNDGITGYNIYRQDPFDDLDDWALIPDSPVVDSEYTDTDIVGNEAYQYRVIGLVGSTEMPDESVYAYAILENAEDNVTTDCVWDTCAFPLMYNPNYLPWSLFNEFAPLAQTPNNGSFCWDESGLQNGPGTLGSYWTGSATLFATPILPLPVGADTCIADFCIRLNNMWPWWPGNHCGGIVGVTDVVQDGPDNPFTPASDHLGGLAYNVPHVQGFSLYGNYTNIDTTNDEGHGVQYPDYQDIQWTGSRYEVPDVFTLEDARVAFAWACGNAAGGTAIQNAGTSYDDIAVLIY